MHRLWIAILLTLSMIPTWGADQFAERQLPTDLTVRTFSGTSVGGELHARKDGSGDLFYTVTAEPVKGSLTIQEDGRFVYTPRQGKLGRDSFYYRTLDQNGELSDEYAVWIQIDPQQTNVVYQDMRGRGEAYAAAVLSEHGLFVGEQIVGQYCFCPEKTVSRGEFLSVCFALSGRPRLETVHATGLADDEEIPVWMKSYVMSAAFTGVRVVDDASFDYDQPITCGEAFEMAAQLLPADLLAPSDSDRILDRAAMALLLLPAME